MMRVRTASLFYQASIQFCCFSRARLDIPQKFLKKNQKYDPRNSEYTLGVVCAAAAAAVGGRAPTWAEDNLSVR